MCKVIQNQLYSCLVFADADASVLSLIHPELSSTGYLESDTTKDYDNEKQGSTGELVINGISPKHGKNIGYGVIVNLCLTVIFYWSFVDHWTNKHFSL